MTPKEGRKYILKNLLITHANDLYIRLATNIPAGSADDVELADLTEATFPGYSQLHAVVFPDPTINGSAEGETESPTLTWTGGGGVVTPETITGLYVVFIDPSFVEHLIFWEPFAASITIAADGEQVQKKLKILDNNYTP